MNLEEKFQNNWQKNIIKKSENSEEKNLEPDFLFYIEALFPIETSQKILEKTSNFLQENNLEDLKIKSPENLYLTLALPGRLGTHFQKNDARFMEKTLKNILKNIEPLEIQIKNFNIFPNTLFLEVHDSSFRLQQLHETICQEIPFSQHPEYKNINFLPHITVAKNINPQDLEKFKNISRETEDISSTLEKIVLGEVLWKNQILEKKQRSKILLKKILKK